MPQTPKAVSPQQKVALCGKNQSRRDRRSGQWRKASASGNTTVRQWLRIYESGGCRRPCTPEKSRHLTAEEQAAVAEYLAGGVSLFDVCKKYGIRSPQKPAKARGKRAQTGGELRGYHGASRHRGGAYTTAADREKIVRECLGRRLRLRRSCIKI